MIKACFTAWAIEIHFVRSSKRFAYILDYSFHLLSQRRISVGRVKKKNNWKIFAGCSGELCPSLKELAPFMTSDEESAGSVS